MVHTILCFVFLLCMHPTVVFAGQVLVVSHFKIHGEYKNKFCGDQNNIYLDTFTGGVTQVGRQT